MKKFVDTHEDKVDNKQETTTTEVNTASSSELEVKSEPAQEQGTRILSHHYDSEHKTYKENINPLQRGRGKIESHQQRYKATFSDSSNEEKLFCIEEDGTEIAVYYNDELAEDKSGKERSKHRKFHKRNKDVKAIVEKGNKIKYKGFTESSDLEYITEANRIKENIIVHKQLESYEYGFTLKVKNLTVSLGDNNKSVVFKKTDNKKTIFTIPAPVMFDARGEESNEIIYEIEEVSSTEYIFKVIADKTWINDATRAFPITIDPQIVVESSEIEIYDARTSELVEKGKVGIVNGVESNLRIKVKNFTNEIPTGKKIIHAFLCLKRLSYTGSEKKTITVTHKGNVIDCFSLGDKDGFIRFDIAKYACNEDLVFDLNWITSSTNTGYIEISNSQSCLVLEYLYDNMFDHEESLMNVQLGRAGTSMVAIDTGEVAHEHIDIIGSTCGLPLDIKHIYRSSRYSETKNSLVGNGWKLNIDQEIKKNIKSLPDSQEGIINIYEDGNGDIHEFIEKYFYVNEVGDKKFIKQSEVRKDIYGNEIYTLNDKKYSVQHASFNQNGDALIADYHYDFESAIEYILSETYNPEYTHFCRYNGDIYSFNLEEEVRLEIGIFTYNGYDFEISLEQTFKENDKEYYIFLGEKRLIRRGFTNFMVHHRGSRDFIKIVTGIEKTSNVKRTKLKARGTEVETYYTTTSPIESAFSIPKARPVSILSDITTRTTEYASVYTYHFKEIEIKKRSGEISEFLPKSYRTEDLFSLESQLVQVYDAIYETSNDLVQLGENYHLFDLKSELTKYETRYNEECKKFNEDKQRIYEYLVEISEIASDKNLGDFSLHKPSLTVVGDEKDYLKVAEKSKVGDLNKVINSVQVRMQRDEINFTKKTSKLKIDIEEATKKLLDAQAYDQEKTFKRTKKRLEDNLEKYKELRKEICLALGRLIEEYKKQPLDYIIFSSGVVLGFNYNGKLVDVGSSEKSDIQIIYDENVITNLVSKEKTIVGFYYNNGELVRMEDPRGRIIHFEYNPTNHQLRRIVYPDTSETLLNYSGDGIEEYQHKRLLSKLTDQNGTKTDITYENEKVTNIKIIPFSEVESSLPLVFNKSIWRSGNGTVKVTDEISKKRINYVVDVMGKILTTYEDDSEVAELNKLKKVKLVNHNYTNKKTNFTIAPHQKTITASLGGFENSTGFTGWWIDGQNAELVTSHFVEGEQAVKIAGNYNKSCIISKNMKPSNWPKNGMFIISMWAKAKSLLTVANHVSNTDEIICQETNAALLDHYRWSRKFSYCVELRHNDVLLETFNYDFDCHNEDWQLGVVLVKLKPEYKQLLATEPFKVTTRIQYVYNSGDAYFDDVRITECDYVMEESDDEGRVILTEDGDYRTTFSDFSGTQPRTIIKTSMKDATKQFVTKNIYNQQKQLVWSQDHAGMITEHKYDEDGNRLLSKTYHQEEPTSAFITEYHSDGEGRTSKEIDARGEEDGIELSTKYTYLDTSEIVTSIEDARGHKTFYGYDYNNDNLLSISSSVNGEKNHILRTYEKGKITKLTQNDTDYEYQYDGLNRITEFKIAGVHYLTNEYGCSEDGEFNVVTQTDGKHEVTITESSLNGEEINTYRMINDDEVLVSEYKKIDDDSYTVNEPLSGRSVQVSKDRIKHLQGTTTVIDRLTTTGDILDTIKTTLNIDGTISTREVEYHYNDEHEHKLQSIKFKEENQSQTFKQDLLNRMSEIATLSNNQKILTTSYGYLQNGDHATNLVKSVKTTTKNRSEHTRYTYDGNGNITSITKKGEIKQRFKYDSLNRLIREDNLDLNATLTWEYDISGNILAKSECAFTLTDDLDVLNRHEYSYNENWKDQLSYYNDEECLYDGIGNPFKYRNQTLVWENGRQLKKFRDVEFKYTSSSIRYEKKSNGVVTTYYLDGSTIIGEKRGSDVLVYQYGLNGISGFSLNNIHYIYEKNLQGDVIAIYNASGDKCAEYTYDAWGQVRVTNIIGTIGEINPFRYRSYYYDEETGLYYLKSRYYDPETGRFINADDISYLDPESINGLNLYSYCGNNPVMLIDSTGHSPEFWMHIGSALMTIGGIALMFVPGGQILGLGLIGAGVGSFIGGNISEMNGGSFASGWLIGGLVGFGLGAGLGYALPYIGSFLGSTAFNIGIPSLSMAGGALALTTTTVAVSWGAVALTGATIMLFAVQRMGPGKHSNNQSENKFIDYLQKKYGLNYDQREILHDEITGKGYTRKFIEELLKWLFNK